MPTVAASSICNRGYGPVLVRRTDGQAPGIRAQMGPNLIARRIDTILPQPIEQQYFHKRLRNAAAEVWAGRWTTKHLKPERSIFAPSPQTSGIWRRLTCDTTSAARINS